jgi:phosphoglycolate phosphatase-like HAD superfamily hydrolase
MFDIDGTLILTGGAGMRAFFRAFERVFEIPVKSEVIRPDGKTDPLIAMELLAYYGQESRWNGRSSDALFEAYLEYLREEMARAKAQDSIRVLPGVTELLQALAPRRDIALGLVTGNLEGGARIKLAEAGLDQYFRFGGYGSDSADRTELIRRAIRRGEDVAAPASVEAAIVIGDTPLDVIHGHAAGASVIAVASARYSVEDLQKHHPDFLVPSLAPIEPVVSFLNSGTSELFPWFPRSVT